MKNETMKSYTDVITEVNAIAPNQNVEDVETALDALTEAAFCGGFSATLNDIVSLAQQGSVMALQTLKQRLGKERVRFMATAPVDNVGTVFDSVLTDAVRTFDATHDKPFIGVLRLALDKYNVIPMNDERAERRIAGRRWDWFTRNPLYVQRNYDEFLEIAAEMDAELCPLIEALNYNVPLDDAMAAAGLTDKATLIIRTRRVFSELDERHDRAMVASM